MSYAISYTSYGANGVLIQWARAPTPALLNDRQRFEAKILADLSDQIVEIIPSYNELLVLFKDAIDDPKNMTQHLKSLYAKSSTVDTTNNNEWWLPVCYDPAFGYDLIELANIKKIDTKSLVDLHCTPAYTVYFIGFLPGFLYLGGLDKKLHQARRNVPRRAIDAGSVGIGGQQTGVYPISSPAGWHIIGHCPIPLFDAVQSPPSPIHAGDIVRFYPISRNAHAQLVESINAHEINLAHCTQKIVL